VEKKKKRLLYAILITAVIMILEVAGGLLVNSLALLSDAAHMFTHVFALGISYFAILISARPADMEKTFGYFRVEVLVAFITCRHSSDFLRVCPADDKS
jgi:cobalt-zinc-cadmium efflux system protein